ncbi:hypothetical protein [Chondromyces crocatus]|uniref:hypothetical protein n=1 Tax=Chondromyces crocatus TaxID=52 RepID=UPI00067BFB90|nr:hypothetical protein [Chondromyces crocatus]
MRSRFRDLAVLAALGALSAFGAVLSPGCGTDAVGVDACRQIEDARCQAASVCGYDEAQVKTCREFYRDQCLRGIQNAEHGEPAESEVEGCIAAVEAVRDCAAAGTPTVGECSGVVLAPTADGSVPPCLIITEQVHRLQACAFVATPPSGGSGGNGGSGGDGAGGSGGSGGSGAEDGSGGSGGPANSGGAGGSSMGAGASGGTGGTGGAGGAGGA